MGQTETSELLRRKVRECRQKAQAATDPEEKSKWDDMAQKFQAIADALDE